MRGFVVVGVALVGLVAVTPPNTFEDGFDATGVDIEAVTRSEPVTGRLAKRSHSILQYEGRTADLGETAVADEGSVPVDRVGNLTTAAPEGDAERRGFAALEQISYNWQTELSGWTILFSPGRSGVLGYTYVESQTIEIFVRGNQSEDLLAHVIAHELGHAVDVSKNSGDDRRAWQEARGITSDDWWPGNGANDFSTGAGDFSESFAAWQVGTSHFRSNLGGAPTSSQIDLMAELATS